MNRGAPEKFTDHQFLDLYAKGLTDKKMADLLGVVDQTIANRRKKMGLPSHLSERWTTKQSSALSRKFTRTNVYLISKELWNWAQYKAKQLELSSVSKYLFLLIEMDKEKELLKLE